MIPGNGGALWLRRFFKSKESTCGFCILMSDAVGFVYQISTGGSI